MKTKTMTSNILLSFCIYLVKKCRILAQGDICWLFLVLLLNFFVFCVVTQFVANLLDVDWSHDGCVLEMHHKKLLGLLEKTFICWGYLLPDACKAF